MWRRSKQHNIKQQHVAKGLSVSAQLVSSMKLSLQDVCQLTFLSLCCLLITVRQSDSTFVPGRCMCPHTERGVRGQLKNLQVHQKSPSCDKVTVIVTLKSDDTQVCVDPEAPMGRQLTRCWNRAQKLGRDVKVCLKRRKRVRAAQPQRSRQRSRGQKRRAFSSNSQ